MTETVLPDLPAYGFKFAEGWNQQNVRSNAPHQIDEIPAKWDLSGRIDGANELRAMASGLVAASDERHFCFMFIGFSKEDAATWARIMSETFGDKRFEAKEHDSSGWGVHLVRE